MKRKKINKKILLLISALFFVFTDLVFACDPSPVGGMLPIYDESMLLPGVRRRPSPPIQRMNLNTPERNYGRLEIFVGDWRAGETGRRRIKVMLHCPDSPRVAQLIFRPALRRQLREHPEQQRITDMCGGDLSFCQYKETKFLQDPPRIQVTVDQMHDTSDDCGNIQSYEIPLEGACTGTDPLHF